MQEKANVLNCYGKTAREYTDALYNELDGKPLDRLLLTRFADENSAKGTIADLGCACGHATKFLFDAGASDVIGIDISPEFIGIAAERHPEIRFEVGDMTALKATDGTFGGVVAFYAIVHFAPEELNVVFAEIFRVLKNNGQFLFCFHTGDEVVRRDEFFGKSVDISFYFFDVDFVLEKLKFCGFRIIDALVRYPYETGEYASKRAYILAEK